MTLLTSAILVALDHGTTCRTPVEISGTVLDFSQAYAVALQIRKRRIARGECPVGYKIGFTNRNIWQEYGVGAPIWASVYDSTLNVAADGRASHVLANAVSPRIEPEIAFRLAGPLADDVDDPLRALESVDAVMSAFEVVDCHYPGWKFEGTDSVVDLGFHRALVLGQPIPLGSLAIDEWAERLRSCQVALERNDEIVERGTGGNALGHPAWALAFLARSMREILGAPSLRRGDIVTTGTLTAALPIASGEHWRMRFSGIPLEPLTLEIV